MSGNVTISGDDSFAFRKIVEDEMIFEKNEQGKFLPSN